MVFLTRSAIQRSQRTQLRRWRCWYTVRIILFTGIFVGLMIVQTKKTTLTITVDVPFHAIQQQDPFHEDLIQGPIQDSLKDLTRASTSADQSKRQQSYPNISPTPNNIVGFNPPPTVTNDTMPLRNQKTTTTIPIRNANGIIVFFLHIPKTGGSTGRSLNILPSTHTQ